MVTILARAILGGVVVIKRKQSRSLAELCTRTLPALRRKPLCATFRNEV